MHTHDRSDLVMEEAEDRASSPFQTAASSEAHAVVDAPPRMQHLLVMRHGDRLDNEDISWIYTAPRPWDPPLTDLGKQRARKVGRSLRLQGPAITRVVCSPFLRCIQTASEVITGLCSLDGSEGDSANVAIDPSKVKVSVEYGLCEVMNAYAIGISNLPPAGPTTLALEELESMLPAGTVDKSVPKIWTKLPDWQEASYAFYERYVNTFLAIANMFPAENILCVTHGEGVSISVMHHRPNVTLYQVHYCAVSHLQRPVHNGATPASAGPFELLIKPGGMSGIDFIEKL